MAIKGNSDVVVPQRAQVRSQYLPEAVGMGGFSVSKQSCSSFRELYTQMAQSSSLGPALSLTTASVTSPSPVTGKIFHVDFPTKSVDNDDGSTTESNLHRERFMGIIDGFLSLEHTFPTAVADSLTYGVSYYETFFQPPSDGFVADSGIRKLRYVRDGDKFIYTI